MRRPTYDPIRRIIRREWPDADPEEIEGIQAILDGYGGEGRVWGRQRVQLAILKLSGGQRERLPELVEMAKRDYRDVVAYAEYPEEMRLGPVAIRRRSRREARAVRERDKAQYRRWLRG